jgi:hypothetical protein
MSIPRAPRAHEKEVVVLILRWWRHPDVARWRVRLVPRRPGRGEAYPGQAMVEFALSITVFLYLVMGIVDLGRAFVTHNLIASAVREGARYGTIPGRTDAQIVGYATGTLGGIPGIAITAMPPITVSGVPVIVQASATFIPITPLVAQVCCGGGSLTLQARSTMVVE